MVRNGTMSFIQKAANTSPDARYPSASQVNIAASSMQIGAFRLRRSSVASACRRRASNVRIDLCGTIGGGSSCYRWSCEDSRDRDVCDQQQQGATIYDRSTSLPFSEGQPIFGTCLIRKMPVTHSALHRGIVKNSYDDGDASSCDGSHTRIIFYDVTSFLSFT